LPNTPPNANSDSKPIRLYKPANAGRQQIAYDFAKPQDLAKVLSACCQSPERAKSWRPEHGRRFDPTGASEQEID